jgi:hypothetical protein
VRAESVKGDYVENKNNFEIINSFFHCSAENFSDHPRIMLCKIVRAGHGQSEMRGMYCVICMLNIQEGKESDGKFKYFL